MTLRAVQSIRTRIAATDERSDQVKPGELEVPKVLDSDGDGAARGIPLLARNVKPARCQRHGERSDRQSTHAVKRGGKPMTVNGGEFELRRPPSEEVQTVTHHEGGRKSDAVKPRVKQQEKANDRTLSPRSAEPSVAVASIEAPAVAVTLQSESDLAKSAGPRLQSKCPICHGPTSSLTGGACATCRRKMDEAMDAQMKRLAEDREFQRELDEALERLPETGKTKACAAGCGEQLNFSYWSDICGKPECVAWALGEKYRRWDAELEQSIKESMHG